jgi:hypothetical protein
VLWLLVTVNIPSSPILVTLMMETIRSSETLVHTGATWHNIPEDGIFHVAFVSSCVRMFRMSDIWIMVFRYVTPHIWICGYR